MREGHELQINIGCDLFLDLQQRLYRQQPRIAGVHVRANRQQAFGHRPIAIRERALGDRFQRQRRFELAPQCNAFEQGAALIDAWQAVAQRCIQVEVRIHERRAHQHALGINDLVSCSSKVLGDFNNFAAHHGDAHSGSPIGEICVFDK